MLAKISEQGMHIELLHTQCSETVVCCFAQTKYSVVIIDFSRYITRKQTSIPKLKAMCVHQIMSTMFQRVAKSRYRNVHLVDEHHQYVSLVQIFKQNWLIKLHPNLTKSFWDYYSMECLITIMIAIDHYDIHYRACLFRICAL